MSTYWFHFSGVLNRKLPKNLTFSWHGEQLKTSKNITLQWNERELRLLQYVIYKASKLIRSTTKPMQGYSTIISTPINVYFKKGAHASNLSLSHDPYLGAAFTNDSFFYYFFCLLPAANNNMHATYFCPGSLIIANQLDCLTHHSHRNPVVSPRSKLAPRVRPT